MEKSLKPILLYDGECAVCRRIGHWVQTAARSESGSSLTVRPIGDDPADLRSLNPALDIWDAYATIHVLMPDGSMKTGGAAVAEVFGNVPSTKWLAALYRFGPAGFRPFAALLDVGYLVLADVRPLLGCESCGTPPPWVKPLHMAIQWIKRASAGTGKRAGSPHATSFASRAASRSDLTSAHPR